MKCDLTNKLKALVLYICTSRYEGTGAEYCFDPGFKVIKRESVNINMEDIIDLPGQVLRLISSFNNTLFTHFVGIVGMLGI